MAEDTQLYQTLGRLEGKMDMLLTQQSGADIRATKMEARITALETLKADQSLADHGLGGHLARLSRSASPGYLAFGLV